jgi:hypothetical protein
VAKSRSRLPRAWAPKVTEDERTRKNTEADLQNGWLARHGRLNLSDERLVFDPTPLDKALMAKRFEILLDDINEVERFPRHVDAGWPGKRARMLLHTEPCTFEFIVGDLDAWIDAIEKVYALRVNAGRPHRPPVKRDGYDNLLLAEE